MYLYTSKELSQFNIKKGVKSEIDKATQDKPESGTKPVDKTGGNKRQIGSANIKDVADDIAKSIKTAPSIGDRLKSLKNSTKNFLIKFTTQFWTYDSSDKGKILLIDIQEKSKLNIEKYKDIESIDIANKIIKFLGGESDEIDKLEPLINDKDFKNIAFKIKFNQNIIKNKEVNTQKENIPIPKEPIIKDKNNIINNDEKKLILKLILQGIKFMFESSLKPPGPPKKEEHKLKVNGFVDKFVNNSYEKLVTLLPLFKKGENEKINHIKMEGEELKKAFECLVTEILKTEPSKTFPLSDKSKVKDKGKYIIYDTSTNDLVSTLKSACDIIIQDPSMDEQNFKNKITQYTIPPNIYSKEQEADKKDTNLIHKMITEMKKIASTPANGSNGNSTTPVPPNGSKGNVKGPPNGSNGNPTPPTSKGGKNIINKNKEYTFILGRKRILNKIGRSYYVKYNSVNIKLTEAKLIEKKILKTKILSKKSKKIHHLI